MASYFNPLPTTATRPIFAPEKFSSQYFLMRLGLVFADFARRREDAAGMRAAAEELLALGLDRQPLLRGQATGIERRHADQRMEQRHHRVVNDLARGDDQILTGREPVANPRQVVPLEAVIHRPIRGDQGMHARGVEHIER